MSIDKKEGIKLKQKLIQTPKTQIRLNNYLKQSIQVLELSSIELIEHLFAEAEINPVIDDVKYDFSSYSNKFGEFQSKTDLLENTLTNYESRYEGLIEQVNLLGLSKSMTCAVKYGIYSIDENGYLNEDLKHWADQCNVSLEMVMEAVNIIQNLKPVGIGTKNYKESILIQMKHQGYSDFFLNNMLDEDLEWIATNNVKKLSKKYDMDDEYIEEIISVLKNCHPKPGQLISTYNPQYIIPEASIVQYNKKWNLVLHNANFPTIVLSEYYSKVEMDDEEAKRYIRYKKQQINELKKSISYRYNTLERVLYKILEIQSDFLEDGWGSLHPLTLNDLSNELDLHPSTISRTISNKYIETPYGTIAISELLQSGVKQNEDILTSSKTIKECIRKVITEENKARPLSDEKIKERILDLYGIKVARRTVMKYRKEMNIDSSTKRKRLN